MSKPKELTEETAAKRLQFMVRKWQTGAPDLSSQAKDVLLQIHGGLTAAGFVCSESGGPGQQQLVASLFGAEDSARAIPGHELRFEYDGAAIRMWANRTDPGAKAVNLLTIDLRREVVIPRVSSHEDARIDLPYSLDVILDAAADYVEHLLEQKSRPIAPALPPSTE